MHARVRASTARWCWPHAPLNSDDLTRAREGRRPEECASRPCPSHGDCLMRSYGSWRETDSKRLGSADGPGLFHEGMMRNL
jgi:hypothetical protein